MHVNTAQTLQEINVNFNNTNNIMLIKIQQMQQYADIYLLQNCK